MVSPPSGLARMKKDELSDLAGKLGLTESGKKNELIDAIKAKLNGMNEIPANLSSYFPDSKTGGASIETEDNSGSDSDKPAVEATPAKKGRRSTPATPKTGTPKAGTPRRGSVAAATPSAASPKKKASKAAENGFNVVACVNKSYGRVKEALSTSRAVVTLFLVIEFYMFIKSFFPCDQKLQLCSAASISYPDFELLSSYPKFWKPFLLYGFYINVLPFLGSMVINLDVKKPGSKCNWSVFTFSVLRYALCFGYILHKSLFADVFNHVAKE
ncbi:hypothetical protein BKA69DRAFT_1062947, partial [Paraphysoderma sedebokerense]